MALSATAIAKAKPAERPFKMTDGGGLYLFVKPNGSKLWRLDYSLNRVRKTISLGALDHLSLADARLRREELKRRLRDGQDPVVTVIKEKREQALARGATLAEVVTTFLSRQKKDGLAASTLKRNGSVLGAVIRKPIGALPIKEIHSSDILSVLREFEEEGKLETARRTRALLSQVWRFAIVNLMAETDPTQVLKGATRMPKVTHMAAITDERALGSLLRRIDAYSGWPTTRLALKFLALTFVRPGEARLARWTEIDLEGAVWNVPAERMKMRRPHTVPLSPQALAVLREAKACGRNSPYLFPNRDNPKMTLSENALALALRRMGYSKDEMSAHGLRSTASTILNSRKFDEELIEIQLAHMTKDRIRAIYNRNEYWPERVKLMNDWADLLDEFRAV